MADKNQSSGHSGNLRGVFGLILTIFVMLVSNSTVSAQPPAGSVDGEISVLTERLNSAPILYNMTTDAVYDIFAHGQELGNRVNVFTKVGDSNSTTGAFLRPIGMKPNPCELGPYGDLQATVDFFSVSPREGIANSFDNTSIAAVNGLNTAGVQDSFWADPVVCRENESPLSCEYRIVKPSVAIIMLGLMDIETITPDRYQPNLDQIVQASIEQGVIPVLTTFSVLPDYPVPQGWDNSIRFNAAILDVVETHQTPLINLWAAVQDLPDYGIGPDRTHLKYVIGQFCSFNGPEKEVGGTLRNLLTLQALDELRRDVLTP
jgi:hypothetical protein